jgi:hypothetical protein
MKVPIPIVGVEMDTSDDLSDNATKFGGVVAGLSLFGVAALAAQRLVNAGSDAAGSDEDLGVV